MNKDWLDFKCEDCRIARENGKGDSFCQKHKNDFIFKLFNPLKEGIDEIKDILDRKIKEEENKWNYKKWERNKAKQELRLIKKAGVREVGSPADR